MLAPNTCSRPALAPDLIANAPKYFSLGTVESYEVFDSYCNLNVKVNCATGVFLLRMYHQGVTAQRVAFLQQLKKGLAQNIHVPEPIAWAPSGDLGLEGEHILELEHFIAHQPVTYTWQHHKRAFPVLGELHDCLRDLVDEQDYVPTAIENYALPAAMSAWLAKTEEKIKASEHVDVEYAVMLVPRARELLARVEHWWQEQGCHLPRQAIHGDFNTGTNVIQDKKQKVAVLDFDFLDIHERVFDIAYSLHFAIGSIEWGKPLGERDWSWITKSAQLYSRASGRPLSQEEWQSLPIQLARIPLFWVCAAGFAADPVAAFLDDARSLESHFWLVDHLPERLPAEI